MERKKKEAGGREREREGGAGRLKVDELTRSSKNSEGKKECRNEEMSTLM